MDVILTGASTIAQAKENTAVFEDFSPLTQKEYDVIDEVLAAIAAKPSGPLHRLPVLCQRLPPRESTFPRCFTYIMSRASSTATARPIGGISMK